MRAPLLQTDDFRRRARQGTLDLGGWRHADAEVIEAQGALSADMAERAVPKLRFLPGLSARLAGPAPRLLDVGAGAAGLSIALCRRFANLEALALEPAPHPAAVAERNVREASLGDRIEIRRQPVEHLTEQEAFDLAFLPQMFLPDEVLPAAVQAVRRALRPGGWCLVAVLSRPGGDLGAAVSRLKNLLWGGNRRDDAAVRDVLASAAFDPVIRAPGRDTIRIVCARRPPA